MTKGRSPRRPITWPPSFGLLSTPPQHEETMHDQSIQGRGYACAGRDGAVMDSTASKAVDCGSTEGNLSTHFYPLKSLHLVLCIDRLESV